MGWTKLQFIEQAYDEIGLASYFYDLTAEEQQNALRKLDTMMSTWNGKGIRLSYPLPSSPSDSVISQETTVPDSANEAIYTNLAIRLAPGVGKVVSLDTKEAANSGYQTLLSRATIPKEMQYPGTMPAGAGNKPWILNNDPFLQKPTNPVDVGSDSVLELY